MSTNIERQIVLDTETTGMNQSGANHYEGHKIIEIGAVELINRRLTGNHFHVYINPHQMVDIEAFKIHGISDEFLKDKPSFKDIAQDFINYIDGAELIIHNAPFDVGFIDYECRLAAIDFKISEYCHVTDTLMMARKMFPGKRNNLDVLCERYQIDNSHRTLHGALLDAEILADVYLSMTGGQTDLSFSSEDTLSITHSHATKKITDRITKLKIINASAHDLEMHQKIIKKISDKSGVNLWMNK